MLKKLLSTALTLSDKFGILYFNLVEKHFN